MPPTITLGRAFSNGEQLTPTKFNQLVDLATITGLVPADFDLSSLQFFTYGPTRPTLMRGAAHYDTTSGLEGMVFAFVSASSASVSTWLYATPRRESMCWASSAISAYTPVFVGKPNSISSSSEYTVFDGTLFTNVWQYSGASGPDSAQFVTVESTPGGAPVKCAWAGMLPDALLLNGASSGASAGSPLFVDYTDPGAFKAGAPTPKQLIFGVNTRNVSSGAGSLLWGPGAAIENIS